MAPRAGIGCGGAWRWFDLGGLALAVRAGRADAAGPRGVRADTGARAPEARTWGARLHAGAAGAGMVAAGMVAAGMLPAAIMAMRRSKARTRRLNASRSRRRGVANQARIGCLAQKLAMIPLMPARRARRFPAISGRLAETGAGVAGLSTLCSIR